MHKKRGEKQKNAQKHIDTKGESVKRVTVLTKDTENAIMTSQRAVSIDKEDLW